MYYILNHRWLHPEQGVLLNPGSIIIHNTFNYYLLLNKLIQNMLDSLWNAAVISIQVAGPVPCSTTQRSLNVFNKFLKNGLCIGFQIQLSKWSGPT